MICKPILFNTDMVRAILAGQKTQTRRAIKPQPKMILSYVACSPERRACGKWRYPSEFAWKMWKDEKYKLSDSISEEEKEQLWTPPANADDILWVRETWSTTDKCGLYPDWPTDGIHYIYKADDPTCDAAKEARWYPSVHMPKGAARIFLRVKDVRVDGLQAMDEEAAIAEGFADSSAGTDSPLTRFAEFWDKTITREDLREFGWHADPWVWVIEFERCKKPEGWN